MEKSQTDFLQECLAEITALKERIAALEQRIQAYEPAPEEDLPVAAEVPAEEVDFTDIQIGVPEERSFVASAPQDDKMGDAPQDDKMGDAPQEAPVILSEAKNLQAEQPAQESPDDTAQLPWRKDKPGIPVKNIRSGISLLDRALFIGTLFKEDFTLYDQTIADLNAMSSLGQAVDYIRTKFPEWDLKSDVVYHFMMSIRKKLG